MKEKILKALLDNRESYLSGAALCSQLGVSRQAVWKSITALREFGYEIESVSNRGYRLLSLPDRLYAPEILSYLPKDCLCHTVECLQITDSTNTRVKQLAESGSREGTLVLAEEQTAGRGRRGRSWVSAPGVGIWMSLLLRPKLPPEKVSGLTLLTALALTKAVKRVCHLDAEIKWPNDVMIAKKKICGILTEMSSEENYIHYVAVGIGINANTVDFPEELRESATSLYQEGNRRVNRNELAAAWAACFCEYYERFIELQSLSFVTEEYNSLLVNRNREVRIYYGMTEQALQADTDNGIARGIDENGALLVELKDGTTKRVVSGEVSVRGIYGYV